MEQNWRLEENPDPVGCAGVDHFVQLLFRYQGRPSGEWMWVQVVRKTDDGWVGLLSNEPSVETSLRMNDRIEFRSSDVWGSFQPGLDVDWYKVAEASRMFLRGWK